MSVDWNSYVDIATDKLSEYKSKVRHEKPELSVDERENVITDLKNRIRRLEEDMAHILVDR